MIAARFGANYGEGYLEGIPISNPYTIQKLAFLVIANYHGFIGGKTIPAGKDVIQMSALPHGIGTVPDPKIFQAIIGKYDQPNIGSKRSIDEIKQNIRKFESLQFLNLVKDSYPNFLEILNIIKQLLYNLLNDINISEKIFQTEIGKLQSYFSAAKDPPNIQAIIQEIYDGDIAIKSQAAQSVFEQATQDAVSQQLEANFDKIDEINNLYMKYVLTEFSEINLRHGTYVEEYPNLDFEGRHSENPQDSMMGLFVVPYDDSLLDKCFKDVIASGKFKDFVTSKNPQFIIDKEDLKNKDQCILRKGTLTYYILKFLGDNYFKDDETFYQTEYVELFEEMSRNYDEDPLTLPGKNPYQTNMTNIKDFIDYIKCFSLKHKDYVEIQLRSHSECMDEIKLGAIPACVYLFTCAKCYFEGVGTEKILRRVKTLDPSGGSKTRRKKPRNKHSRKSRKRNPKSNSLIRKVKRKPRK